MTGGYATAEEAALASWAHTPAATARVVEVRSAGDQNAVWVVLQLGEPAGFHDQDIVTCAQDDDGLWHEAGSVGAGSS